MYVKRKGFQMYKYKLSEFNGSDQALLKAAKYAGLRYFKIYNHRPMILAVGAGRDSMVDNGNIITHLDIDWRE